MTTAYREPPPARRSPFRCVRITAALAGVALGIGAPWYFSVSHSVRDALCGSTALWDDSGSAALAVLLSWLGGMVAVSVEGVLAHRMENRLLHWWTRRFAWRVVFLQMLSGPIAFFVLISQAHIADHRVRSADRRLANAIRGYAQQHGSPPPDLASLVPDHIRSIPRSRAGCGGPPIYGTLSVRSRLLWWSLANPAQAADLLTRIGFEPPPTDTPAALVVELIEDRVELVATVAAATSLVGTELRANRASFTDRVSTKLHGQSAEQALASLGAPTGESIQLVQRWWVCSGDDVVDCGGDAGRCSGDGRRHWGRWPDAVRQACEAASTARH